MKRHSLILLLLLISLPYAFAQWEKPAQPPASADLRTLAAHPAEAGKMIVASSQQIFEAAQPNRWKALGSLKSAGKIKRLLSFSEFPSSLFALTDDRIFLIPLDHKRWSTVYETHRKSRFVLSFAVAPGDRHHWFLGTSEGLLESDDAGATWFSFKNFNQKSVSLLKFARGKLFIGAGDKLYVSEDFAHFKPILSLSSSFVETEESFDEEGFENPDATPVSFYELIAPEDSFLPLWTASEKGVFESRDDGESWERLPQSGLRSIEVRHLTFSQAQKMLFAGTAAGIYVYKNSSWKELYQGLERTEIRGLALILRNGQEYLAAITPAGFFQHPILPDQVEPSFSEVNPQQLALFQNLTRLEPSASDIHNAVVRYGNLRNGKIKRWQAASRLSALFPSFSFGKSFSKNNNVDIDRAGSSDPDRFILGPEDIDKNWDMDIGWDLGNFIYSSDQTSIDSREKIMVEFRRDMIAEATRIYYERRRLQAEIVMTPAADEKEHLDHLLRMDELTSLLDGMTNAYLSARLERLYREHPEFGQLWEYTGAQEHKGTSAPVARAPVT